MTGIFGLMVAKENSAPNGTQWPQASEEGHLRQVTKVKVKDASP
jgi:hypothetical protein